MENGTLDKTLIFDTYKLRGICYFRLKNLTESVKNYNFANNVKEERDKELRKIDSKEEVEEHRKMKQKELEYTFINLFIEETQMVFNDPEFKT